MYKELATIKDGNEPTHFLVWDGEKCDILTMDKMKEEAAAGNVDTLAYEDGKFIPILQGNILKDIKKSLLPKRRSQKVCNDMTFEDFVDNDVVFQEKDFSQLAGTILATVCAALEIKNKTAPSMWQLTIAFYSPNQKNMDNLREKMNQFGWRYKIGKDYGDIILANMFVAQDDFSYELLRLQVAAGVELLFNMETFDVMDKRMDFYFHCLGFFARKIISKMRPSAAGLLSLAGSIRINAKVSE